MQYELTNTEGNEKALSTGSYTATRLTFILLLSLCGNHRTPPGQLRLRCTSMLNSSLHTGTAALYRRAAVARPDTLHISQYRYKFQAFVARLQTHQRPVVTSAMSASHDVVSEEHKPNFKKQNQEFIGTVLFSLQHHKCIQTQTGFSLL